MTNIFSDPDLLGFGVLALVALAIWLAGRLLTVDDKQLQDRILFYLMALLLGLLAVGVVVAMAMGGLL